MNSMFAARPPGATLVLSLDPGQAVISWRRFAEYCRKRGGRVPKFLSTRPLNEGRISSSEKQMPKAMAGFQRAKGPRP